MEANVYFWHRTVRTLPRIGRAPTRCLPWSPSEKIARLALDPADELERSGASVKHLGAERRDAQRGLAGADTNQAGLKSRSSKGEVGRTKATRLPEAALIRDGLESGLPQPSAKEDAHGTPARTDAVQPSVSPMTASPIAARRLTAVAMPTLINLSS